MELIQTRLLPPHSPSKLLDRPRLFGFSEKIEKTRITLIHAPAGFGKTSLLCQWFDLCSADNKTPCWLTVDNVKWDSIDLYIYLAATLEQSLDEKDELVKKARFMSDEALLATLINFLCEQKHTIFVFIDDIHLLPDSAQQGLNRLLDLTPNHVHFILSSREIPRLPLGRYRSLGQMFEISIEQIRFTDKETKAFMQIAGGFTDLSEDEATLFEQNIEGWVTGIKLASIALQQQGQNKQLLTSFSGAQHTVADFFSEEVLSSQTEQVQEFLIKTSVLNKLCPDLCNAVTANNNARQMLDEIESAGLFVVQLDQQKTWYRYHTLFADFLIAKLQQTEPDLENELLARASQWCLVNNNHIEAIEYALKAKQPELAAQILESRSLGMTYNFQIRFVNKFSEQIPKKIINQYPLILLTSAWLLIRKLQFGRVKSLLKQVEEWLQQQKKQANNKNNDKINLVEYLLLHRQMMLCSAQDNKAFKVVSMCNQLLNDYPDQQHPFLIAGIYAQLIYAESQQYQLQNIQQRAAKATGILKRSEYNLGMVGVQSVIGGALFFMGDFDSAVQSLQQGLKEAHHFAGKQSGLAALVEAPLSAIHYERNQLNRAEQFTSSLSLITEFAFVEQILFGYLTKSKIEFLHGDHKSAGKTLDECMQLALDRNIDQLRLAIIAERMRQMQQSNVSSEQIIKYLEISNIKLALGDVLPKNNTTTLDTINALIYLRSAKLTGKINNAIKLAKQWRTFCFSKGAVLWYLRWSILLAELQLINREPRPAQRSLRKAMTYAEPIQAIRSFIDAGPAIKTLLVDARNNNKVDTNDPIDVFSQQILDVFDNKQGDTTQAIIEQTPAEGLYGKLTERELEILAFVSSGLSNKEVALKLGMTEGSVKWYMQQIFDKLGTRRRLQVVSRARQLGLIT